MSGTRKGGKQAAEKLTKKDPDFYKKIGAKGGKKGRTGGFAAGEEGRRRAREAGRVGGTISRRRPKEPVYTALPDTHAANLVADEERTEIAERVTKEIMSYQHHKSVKKPVSLFDRVRRARV